MLFFNYHYYKKKSASLLSIILIVKAVYHRFPESTLTSLNILLLSWNYTEEDTKRGAPVGATVHKQRNHNKVHNWNLKEGGAR